MAIQFTDDEIETIKSIINEWGSDCPGTDVEKVKELEYKLGLSIRPTPEEIAERERKRKEWAESPTGKLLTELFELYKGPDILYGSKELVGSNLRINLPNDYNVKKD